MNGEKLITKSAKAAVKRPVYRTRTERNRKKDYSRKGKNRFTSEGYEL